MPPDDKESQAAAMTFEAALARLEAVVRALESGESTLDQSLTLFQEGIALARYCQQQLDAAEGRIEALLSGDEHDTRTVPFTPPGGES